MGLCVVLTGQSSLLKRGVVEEGLVDCSMGDYIRILLCPHPVLGALPQIVEVAGQGVSGPHVFCVSVGSLWLYLAVSGFHWFSLALTGYLPVSLWLSLALCDSHSGPLWLTIAL